MITVPIWLLVYSSFHFLIAGWVLRDVNPKPKDSPDLIEFLVSVVAIAAFMPPLIMIFGTIFAIWSGLVKLQRA